MKTEDFLKKYEPTLYQVYMFIQKAKEQKYSELTFTIKIPNGEDVKIEIEKKAKHG